MLKSSTTIVPAPAKSTDRVSVAAATVLSIVKHASESNGYCCGQLLGFEEEGNSNLKVSSSFALPPAATDNDTAGMRSKAMLSYQESFHYFLEEANTETSVAGWYLCTALGDGVFSQPVVENMLYYQNINPEAILLVYDLTKSEYCNLSLRAFRLSERFLNAKKENESLTSDLLQSVDLNYSNLYTELPISIENSNLITLYLQSQQAQSMTTSKQDNAKLAVFNDEYLEKNIEAIFESIDDFHYEQGNYNYYQRHLSRERAKIQQWLQKRKADNAAREADGKPLLSLDDWKTIYKLPEEPSRLDNLLISAQILDYCKSIEEYGGVTASKMFAK